MKPEKETIDQEKMFPKFEEQSSEWQNDEIEYQRLLKEVGI